MAKLYGRRKKREKEAMQSIAENAKKKRRGANRI